MHGNCSPGQRPGSGRNSVEQDQKLIGPAEAHHEFACQIGAQYYQPVVWECVVTAQIIRDQGNRGISVEHDQMIIRPGETLNYFTHQILIWFDQQLFWKCAESAQQVRHQEMVGIQWSVTNSQPYLASTIMNVSTKFDIDPLSCLPENTRKLPEKSEARKWLECNRAWPKVNQIWGVPWWMYPRSVRPISWADYPEMHGNNEIVTDRQTDGRTSKRMDGQTHSYKPAPSPHPLHLQCGELIV